MYGSQKIPQRWLETLAFHASHGRHCNSILTALAAWLLHVRGDFRSVDDPMAKQLAGILAQSGEAGILNSLFGTNGFVSSIWTPTQYDATRILTVMRDLSKERRLRRYS